MRTFIVVGAIMIVTSLYEVNGRDISPMTGVGWFIVLVCSLWCDNFEEKRK